MLALFHAILPVFLTIFAGMLLERLRVLPEDIDRVLGVLVVKVCLPCLLFHYFAGVTPEQLSRGRWWLCVLGCQAAVMLAVCLMDRLRGASAGEGMIAGLEASFSNVAFMGLPVVLSVLPDDPEAPVICGLLIISINTVAIPGQVFLDIWHRRRSGDEIGGGLAAHAWHVLRHYILGNFLLMATVIGLVVALLRVPVWAPLERTIEGIGLLSPMSMLLALGYGLRAKVTRAVRTGSSLVGRQLWLLSWKLVLGPGVMCAALVAAGCQGPWVAVPVIVAGTGTAVVTALFAELYQARPEETSLTVAVSNVVCLATLMGWLWMLRELGHLG